MVYSSSFFRLSLFFQIKYSAKIMCKIFSSHSFHVDFILYILPGTCERWTVNFIFLLSLCAHGIISVSIDKNVRNVKRTNQRLLLRSTLRIFKVYLLARSRKQAIVSRLARGCNIQHGNGSKRN